MTSLTIKVNSAGVMRGFKSGNPMMNSFVGDQLIKLSYITAKTGSQRTSVFTELAMKHSLCAL